MPANVVPPHERIQIAPRVVELCLEAGLHIDDRHPPAREPSDEVLVEPLLPLQRLGHPIPAVREHYQQLDPVRVAEFLHHPDHLPGREQGSLGEHLLLRSLDVVAGLTGNRNTQSLAGRLEKVQRIPSRALQGQSQVDQGILAEGREQKLGVPHAAQFCGHADRRPVLDAGIGRHVHPQARTGEALPDVSNPGHQVPVVVVIEDVEDQIIRAQAGGTPQLHPQIGLVDAVAADAVVADRLLQVSGQVLLPGLPVIDLVAMGEAVAVGVDASRAVGAVEQPPGAVGLIVVERVGAIDPVATVARLHVCAAQVGIVDPAVGRMDAVGPGGRDDPLQPFLADHVGRQERPDPPLHSRAHLTPGGCRSGWRRPCGCPWHNTPPARRSFRP